MPNSLHKAAPGAGRKAVQIGAGNIGRGFLGPLLFEGGYRTVFLDADAGLVAALNKRGGYPLRLVSDAETLSIPISGVAAIDPAAQPSQAAEAIAGAEIVSVAVGVHALPRIAPLLAAGLEARARADRPALNIFLCENQWHAASLVRGLLEPLLSDQARRYCETRLGLVETVIGRMVPAPTEALHSEDPLLIVAEPYKELPVARAMLRGVPPTLPGLLLADNFDGYEARKLFLHNMSHAALAYLGYGRGHEFIWQCAADPEIAAICRAALAEVVPALAAEYEFAPADLAAFSADLLRRFANRALGDTVARVAADPLRKLRPHDRLIGAATLCLKRGVVPGALARIIAAALRYAAPGDLSAAEMQRQRQLRGDAGVLETVCAIAPGSDLARKILENLEKLDGR